jgi:hypothetical protein
VKVFSVGQVIKFGQPENNPKRPSPRVSSQSKKTECFAQAPLYWPRIVQSVGNEAL